MPQETTMPKSHKVLYALYILIWIFLAINPKYPEDWLLENVLVFIFFPIIIWVDLKFKLSLSSIAFMLIFGILHSIGSHYTYSEVPYLQDFTSIFGSDRNNFDRLVHFSLGLLIFKPLFEIVRRCTSGFNSALVFTFTTIATIATTYELIEWAAATLFHPDLGSAFLGTQGDEWDAQKDTLVALIGASINIFIFKLFLKDKR